MCVLPQISWTEKKTNTTEHVLAAFHGKKKRRKQNTELVSIVDILGPMNS